MSKFIAHKRQNGKGAKEDIQELSTHLSETGEIAGDFASKISLEEIGQLIGLLHDLGKYAAVFQAYIASAVGELDKDDADYVDANQLKGKIDHSSAGAQYIWQAFSRFGDKGQGELAGQILAICIASHHSGLIDCFDKKSLSKFEMRMQKSDELTHLEECKTSIGKEILGKIEKLSSAENCTQLLNKIITLTSLNKGGSSFTKIDWFNVGFFTRFLFSVLVDADRLNSAEFENPSRKRDRLDRKGYFKWKIPNERLENYLSGLKSESRIDGLRRSISENCFAKASKSQGIFTLTAPTGGGKTLASLRYALRHASEHGLDRIIYIIPYTSIIEQNASAIRDVIENEGDQFPWVLEHHSNLEPELQTWQNKLISENWNSPIVLTTMVQFLETCFTSGTRSVRRLHQLANSVLIFDEIQTLPINCTHIFCNALNFLVDHCGSTALLCTATQPLLNNLKAKNKGQLTIPVENEIITDVSNLFDDLSRVEIKNTIKPGGWCAEEIANLAIEQFYSTNSVLVIVNTKAWAKYLYQLCKNKIESGSLFHLSTHQCPQHRKEILNLVKQRIADRLPVLCISTQLIEAGVDISFASVIRFLAGLDSIAQAAGRCNRHGEATDENGNPSKGNVYVVNPDKETTGLLKDIEQGKMATQRVLDDGFEDLVNPEAIERYFKYYFHDRADDMTFKLDTNRLGRSDTLFDLLSDNCNSERSFHNRKNGFMPLMSQAFMEAGKQFKAIDAPTHSVIVPHGEGKEIITKLCAVDQKFDPRQFYSLLQQAQKYSVNVFPNIWDNLTKAKAVQETQSGIGIYYLNEQYYCKDFGLSIEPKGSMEAYHV